MSKVDKKADEARQIALKVDLGHPGGVHKAVSDAAKRLVTKEAVREAPKSYKPGCRGSILYALDAVGTLKIDHVCDTYNLSRSQLAETIGLPLATLSKADRRGRPRTQRRIFDMLEVLCRIEEWAGGPIQAMAWYRSQPIPALDGRTSEALVKDSRAGAVREYLDHLALGGFA